MYPSKKLHWQKHIIFVAGRDDSLPCAHGMPNGIVGNSEIADGV